MDVKILEEIGLTKSETNVYVALLELGGSTTGKIVGKSGASSSKIYEILDRLMQKGLASFIIKERVKYFEAAPPDRIMDYMKEKESNFNEQKKKLKELLPELELKRTISKYKSEATIYKGMKGLETAFNDEFNILKEGDVVHTFVVGRLDDQMSDFFVKHYTKRSERGIKTKTIFSEEGRKKYDERKHIKGFEGKIVSNLSASPATINIYGDRINIRIGDSHDVVTVMIDNKKAVSAFLEQFNLLWNQDTRIVKGLDAIQNLFEEMLDAGSCDLIGARGYFVDERPGFIDEWEKRAVKKGFKMRNVVDSETKGHRITKFPFVKTKYTLQKEFANLSVFWIYGNKVCISNWMEKEPTAIIIENKNLHNMYKKQFELLWTVAD